MVFKKQSKAAKRIDDAMSKNEFKASEKTYAFVEKSITFDIDFIVSALKEKAQKNGITMSDEIDCDFRTDLHYQYIMQRNSSNFEDKRHVKVTWKEPLPVKNGDTNA